LVFMAMLFMLEERIRAAQTYPLLSCSDIEELLGSMTCLSQQKNSAGHLS